MIYASAYFAAIYAFFRPAFSRFKCQCLSELDGFRIESPMFLIFIRRHHRTTLSPLYNEYIMEQRDDVKRKFLHAGIFLKTTV